MSKFIAILALFISISTFSIAQKTKNTAIVKGKIINATSKAPFNDIKVSIPALNVFTTTDGDGNFVISEVPFGSQTVVISNFNINTETKTVTVDKQEVDMGDILVTPNGVDMSAQENAEIPTIVIDDNGNTSTEDDGVSAQNMGGAMAASNTRDQFLGAMYSLVALYNFHYRGLQSGEHDQNINGITINNLETNAVSFNQFGKLYDVFRLRDQVYGLGPSSYAFGQKTGTEYRDASAANQYAETKVAYVETDRNYNKGVTLTHSSGMNANGWAYTASFAKRWADKGYFPGTSYNDYAYSAGVSKKLGKGLLNLTTVSSPIDHAKAASATKEAYALDGSNYYNHNWGYDNGDIRNARVQKEFRPLTILNYEYKPNDKTRWNTAVGYEFGKDKESFIDYYNASSPYGDYYKNMPSYWYTMSPPDSTVGNSLKQEILADPAAAMQINWGRMYQANYLNTQTMYNVNGVAGNNYTGKQSSYVLSNTVANLKKYSFNTNIEHVLTDNITFTGGLTATSQSTENYNQLADLLGGDYYVNYNNFASQQYVGSPTYNQNNLNQPNAVIKVGDKYGNDYAIKVNNALVWGQGVYTLDKFSFFAAVTAGDYSFSRDGYFRNGLFPDNSFGKSPSQNFLTYAVKGGATYKIDLRNTFFVNAAYSVTPPTPTNTYISAPTRDFTVSNPTVQNNKTAEAGYYLNANKWAVKVLGYVADVTNATEIKRFYDDDPAYNTSVNYVMTNENTRNIGTELSLMYKISRQFTALGIASVGQAFYTNNPNINVYLDNQPTTTSTPSTTYIKNYYLSSGPQSSYIAALNYHPKSWNINVSFNYFDRNYVEINPNRRTTAAGGFYTQGTPEWASVMNQEELPSAFTIDMRAGKNFQLSKMSKKINSISSKSVLNISASIGNLLNNTNVINSGYEQLRYDFTNYNSSKFANKYIYGMGINFSINASLRF